MRGSGVSASGFSAERARASATNARSARRAASVKSFSAGSAATGRPAFGTAGANVAQAGSMAIKAGITARAIGFSSSGGSGVLDHQMAVRLVSERRQSAAGRIPGQQLIDRLQKPTAKYRAESLPRT